MHAKTLSQMIQAFVQLLDRPRPLVEILADALVEREPSLTVSVARERAEKDERRVKSQLINDLRSAAEIGRPASIAFNSVSDDLIQGVCFEEPSDSDELRGQKRNRARSGKYREALLSIAPCNFEALCGGILSILGVKNPSVTQSSGDEGIDFFGKLKLDSMFYPTGLASTVQKQLDVWLVGQAKRYTRKAAGTPEIRALVGSVQLARAAVYGAIDSPYADLALRPADAVFIVFVTSGSI